MKVVLELTDIEVEDLLRCIWAGGQEGVIDTDIKEIVYKAVEEAKDEN